MDKENKFKSVTAVAQRILDAYGGHETSDSPRVIYTVGDLNIAREGGILEIIFRGTLVFRYAPKDDTSGRVFEEHGVWLAEVERVAQTLPEPTSMDNTEKHHEQ